MKRPAKMILFIAIAAVTFGSLSYFIGRGHYGPGFRNRGGCERPWQDAKPGPGGTTQKI